MHMCAYYKRTLFNVCGRSWCELQKDEHVFYSEVNLAHGCSTGAAERELVLQFMVTRKIVLTHKMRVLG